MVIDWKDVNLKALKECVSKACGAAFDSKLQGAVNWVDLRCVTAQKMEDDMGHVSYRVVIEEASPNDDRLQSFVFDYLKAHGYDDVESEVVTQW